MNLESRWIMEKIFRDVKMLIEVNCFINVDNVTMDSVFFDLGLDELDMVDLIINVEDFYYIEISDEEYNTLKTVGELCNLIYDKIKKGD